MMNLTNNNFTKPPAFYHGPTRTFPVMLDQGPAIEFTEVKNEASLSVICLSNGIELETNHDDSFVMNDTVSGYYFTSEANGRYVFGKAGKKIAELRLLHSSESRQNVISIKNASNKEKVCRITFMEIKKMPKSSKEYILVQARAEEDSDSPILSKIDSYLLQKFSFSMRKIVEHYPEGISPASENISVDCCLASVGAVLSLVGICLTVNGYGNHYFAVDVNLLVSFFALSQKN